MRFLYDNFDQLIFYDLNINTLKFSDDGGHEYIKNFPDPQNKITLIEKRNLDDVKNYTGASFIIKRKMFAVGSSYVKDDMDVFWCDDMDEFFNKSLIKKVEDMFMLNKNAKTILIPHLMFFKNDNFVYCEKDGNDKIWLPAARITKHKRGNIYGHCSIQKHYGPITKIQDECWYHFSYVGEQRIALKIKLYTQAPMRSFYNKVWKNFDESKVSATVFGTNMHPVKPWGIKRYDGVIPDYIDIKMMMSEL